MLSPTSPAYRIGRRESALDRRGRPKETQCQSRRLAACATSNSSQYLAAPCSAPMRAHSSDENAIIADGTDGFKATSPIFATRIREKSKVKALVLVDIQNDFLSGGALPVPAGHEVIPVANRLMPRYELVVATQDWHPPNHHSFARHHGRKSGDVIEVDGLTLVLWPDHCVQGTPGAAFPNDLRT